MSISFIPKRDDKALFEAILRVGQVPPDSKESSVEETPLVEEVSPKSDDA